MMTVDNREHIALSVMLSELSRACSEVPKLAETLAREDASQHVPT